MIAPLDGPAHDGAAGRLDEPRQLVQRVLGVPGIGVRPLQGSQHRPGASGRVPAPHGARPRGARCHVAAIHAAPLRACGQFVVGLSPTLSRHSRECTKRRWPVASGEWRVGARLASEPCYATRVTRLHSPRRGWRRLGCRPAGGTRTRVPGWRRRSSARAGGARRTRVLDRVVDAGRCVALELARPARRRHPLLLGLLLLRLRLLDDRRADAGRAGRGVGVGVTSVRTTSTASQPTRAILGLDVPPGDPVGAPDPRRRSSTVEPSGTLRSTEPRRPGCARRFAPWVPVPIDLDALRLSSAPADRRASERDGTGAAGCGLRTGSSVGRPWRRRRSSAARRGRGGVACVGVSAGRRRSRQRPHHLGDHPAAGAGLATHVAPGPPSTSRSGPMTVSRVPSGRLCTIWPLVPGSARRFAPLPSVPVTSTCSVRWQSADGRVRGVGGRGGRRGVPVVCGLVGGDVADVGRGRSCCSGRRSASAARGGPSRRSSQSASPSWTFRQIRPSSSRSIPTMMTWRCPRTVPTTVDLTTPESVPGSRRMLTN